MHAGLLKEKQEFEEGVLGVLQGALASLARAPEAKPEEGEKGKEPQKKEDEGKQ